MCAGPVWTPARRSCSPADGGRPIRYAPAMGETWINAAADSSAESLLALRPDLAGHLEAFDSHAAASIGPRLRTLLEIRAAQLLRNEGYVASADPELVDQATNWYSHAALSDVERTSIEVCEAFLIDHHSITDDQILRLQHLLGEQGTVALLMNIAMLDGFTKFRRVFAVEGI